MGIPSRDKKKVLVTGASGFTGRYVVDSLKARGFCPIGTSASSELDDPEFDLSDASLVNDLVSVVKPSYVIHLAAVSFVAHEDVSEIYKVNVLGTRNLLRSLSDLETPPRVVLASSANIYGNNEASVLSEEVAPAPTNDYAVSKIAMEYVSHLWEKKLPTVIVRPFNYTGVGQSEKFLIPKIVKHFRERAAEIQLGNLDIFRDFSDVRDVALAYCHLATESEVTGVFNTCTGITTSLRQVIALCQEITGHRLKVSVNPSYVRSGEVTSLVGSNRRLLEQVPSLTFRDIKETLVWMLKV